MVVAARRLMAWMAKRRVEKILGMEFVTIYFNEWSGMQPFNQFVAERAIPGLKQRGLRHQSDRIGPSSWKLQLQRGRTL